MAKRKAAQPTGHGDDASENKTKARRLDQPASTTPTKHGQILPSPQSPYQSQPQSPLLRLSPELRNIIYRTALLTHTTTPITIPPTGLVQPALLRTSRQLRAETTSIYLRENAFRILVDDLAVRVPPRHWLASAPVPGQGNFRVRLAGALNWPNLLAWCRRVHEAVFLMPEAKSAVGRVVRPALQIAKVMRGLPWEEVLKVLEQYRRGCEGMGEAGGKWVMEQA